MYIKAANTKFRVIGSKASTYLDGSVGDSVGGGL